MWRMVVGDFPTTGKLSADGDGDISADTCRRCWGGCLWAVGWMRNGAKAHRRPDVEDGGGIPQQQVRGLLMGWWWLD